MLATNKYVLILCALTIIGLLWQAMWMEQEFDSVGDDDGSEYDYTFEIQAPINKR